MNNQKRVVKSKAGIPNRFTSVVDYLRYHDYDLSKIDLVDLDEYTNKEIDRIMLSIKGSLPVKE